MPMRLRALTIVAALVAAAMPPIAVPAAAQEAPLIDQTGRSFSLASLRGRPLVVTFISAHCTDACPLVDGQFADAAARIARQRLTARLLTITLDPDHDPPGLMRALAKRFDADPRYWLLASGLPARVEPIVRAFGVVTESGKDGYREAHTTFVYVFDANGNLSKTLLASSGLGDDVVAAVRALQTAVPR